MLRDALAVAFLIAVLALGTTYLAQIPPDAILDAARDLVDAWTATIS